MVELLRKADQGEVRCLGCFISLMEVLYRVWKDESEQAGRLAYSQCLSLPITWVHEDSRLLEQAAQVKACNPMSLADAWIAACAQIEGAQLVHKDPEFEPLAIEQVVLPYKPLR